MYYLSKKEFQKDRIKVLLLGLIIGACVGVCVGFLWGTLAVEEMIQTSLLGIPQQVNAIREPSIEVRTKDNLKRFL